MEYKFSQELIKNTIDYFLEAHSVEVSEAQADEYLDSMAGFYSAISRKNAGE